MAYMTWLQHAIVLFFLVPLVRAYLHYLFRVRAVGAVRNAVEYRQTSMLDVYMKLFDDDSAVILAVLLGLQELNNRQARSTGRLVNERDAEHIKRWKVGK